ncbi:chemotaxis protein CheW [Kovacikia minuta CCNUW1]|uniref:chemotaxis protein CheW n=1 Tax=Kovacikia minuta TaxID=2931930 RepID=UPI001CCAD0D9|nr:chemotaxis protein CheW [Kovacikia minuta]UBF24714.1 chemotaxis protein CheW [Kovacikia minuta CCNUW1]
MTHSLAPRSRRLKSDQLEANRHLIVFSLRQERFALPVQAAQKVIPISNLRGYIPGCDSHLILQQNYRIPVINIEQQIFGSSTPQNLLAAGSTLPSTQPSLNPILESYLLVIQNLQGEVLGLPIATQPILQRIPESAFAPISATSLNNVNIRYVSALITLPQNQSPIFLLNLSQLFFP